MISGLEQDNFCVHTPIAVSVTAPGSTYLELQILINGDPVLIRRPRMYKSANNIYYIDLSSWIKFQMVGFNDTRSYIADELTVYPNTYEIEATIQFIDNTNQIQSVTKTFVHCSLYDRVLQEDTSLVRIWQEYPVSWKNNLDGQLTYYIPKTIEDIIFNYRSSRPVEFGEGLCYGHYLKWLNEYGTYNYWLFPKNLETVTESEEILRLPRSIYSSSRNSNQDTAGFEQTDMITFRDIVLKKFWPLFKSLPASPEVYMLKESWQLGTTAGPNDWIKLIQSDVPFERFNGKRNSAEVEFEFELPKPYTQKMI